jgi:hypothetical protein
MSNLSCPRSERSRPLTCAGVGLVGGVAAAPRRSEPPPESQIGCYKTELINPDGPWRDLAQVEAATLDWVFWFNAERVTGLASS